jgi:hypothetical protein
MRVEPSGKTTSFLRLSTTTSRMLKKHDNAERAETAEPFS